MRLTAIQAVLLVVGFLLGALYALSFMFKDRRKSLAIKTVASLTFAVLGIICYFKGRDVFGAVMLAGLITGAVADVVFGLRHVVEKQKKPLFFKLGVAVFAIGHVLYIIAFNLIGPAPFWVYICGTALGVLICSIPVWTMKLRYGGMRYAIFPYGIILGCMLSCAVYHAATCGDIQCGILIAVAAFLFSFSDCVLVYTTFKHNNLFCSFLNLIPYYTAQLLFALAIQFAAR